MNFAKSTLVSEALLGILSKYDSGIIYLGPCIFPSSPRYLWSKTGFAIGQNGALYVVAGKFLLKTRN